MFVIPICDHSKLVVVGDLYVFRSFLGPNEAHAELIVDPDRMFSITIPAQSLKPISRRRAQIIQVNRSIKIAKFPAGDFHKVSRKAFRALALIDRLSHPILEALNHASNVSVYDTYGNWFVSFIDTYEVANYGYRQAFGAARRTPIPPHGSLSRKRIPACSKADWMRIRVET